MPYGSLLVAIGRLTATAVKGTLKSILANVAFLEDFEKDPGAADASSSEPMWGPPGFYCRPMPPVLKKDATGLKPEGACEVMALRMGDQVMPCAYRELRCNASVNPAEGNLGLAHYGGGFAELGWNATKDGTNITLYALRKKTDGTVDKAHLVQLDSSVANSSIALLHEYGHCVLLNKTGSVIILNKGGDAMVEVKDGQVTIMGGQIVLAGGVMLGDKNPALGDFVMLATQLLAWVGQVNGSLSALNTLLVTTGLPVTGGAGGTAKAAAGVTVPAAVPVAATMTKAK